MKLFDRILGVELKREPIGIVSGLPRSGTSMMMQMLAAGGMPVVVDDIRKPNQDNPRGYYEFEKVKEIQEDNSWLEDCRGKFVKMASVLLYHLPSDNKYKVIFMTREMDEILASQKMMLERLGRGKNDISDVELAKRFKEHLQDIRVWIETQENIEVIYMKYSDIINDPYKNANTLSHFLNRRLNVDEMARAVDKRLYRQRRIADGQAISR